MSRLEVDTEAISRIPFGTVRDYPILPLSVTDARIVLAVPNDVECHVKQALDFILCTEIEYRIVCREELDEARRTYYGIGVTCTRCPFCGSSDIAELIWDLAFDFDPRSGDRGYELADGRGLAQQNDDPRWICRSCTARWGWRQIIDGP